MRQLALLATAVVLIAASGQAVAGPFSPAGASQFAGRLPIELVQDKRKSETLKQKVRRVWRDLTGYKFEVSCPWRRATCTETGNSREDARNKCISRNPFCWVADSKNSGLTVVAASSRRACRGGR
jgi:hypothetical protein